MICRDYLTKLAPVDSQSRSVHSVSVDVDRLFSSKSLGELDTLESQISTKLASNEPIDVEYWENLLTSIAVYKAKAELNKVYKSVIDSRLANLRQQQALEATIVKEKLALLLTGSDEILKSPGSRALTNDSFLLSSPLVEHSSQLDPEPLLKLRPEDRTHDVVEEGDFMNKIVSFDTFYWLTFFLTARQQALERRRISKLGYVSLRHSRSDRLPQLSIAKALETPISAAPRFASVINEDFSQATTALYEREVARGVQENEEIFAGEEEVSSASKPQWANKYRPRKPRYFNRVQMGYEWNKYNQTHYDHDNPPPKVVQGYKFNIFYPDMIDKVKAPTYRIERENGRKRGQSFAPAGEEDTCLIRFISGPPYEDVAFRIVDKEWDYSAKRERGFRSSFDKVSCFCKASSCSYHFSLVCFERLT